MGLRPDVLFLILPPLAVVIGWLVRPLRGGWVLGGEPRRVWGEPSSPASPPSARLYDLGEYR